MKHDEFLNTEMTRTENFSLLTGLTRQPYLNLPP